MKLLLPFIVPAVPLEFQKTQRFAISLLKGGAVPQEEIDNSYRGGKFKKKRNRKGEDLGDSKSQRF